LFVGNLVGNFHHAFTYDPVHHADVLGKTTTAGLKPRRSADLFINRALREDLFPTVIALATGYVMKHHHAVPNGEVFYSFSHRNHLASHFVAKNARSGMRACQNFLEIGPANAAGVYTYQQLSLADFRYRNRLQTDIILTAIDSSLHRPCRSD